MNYQSLKNSLGTLAKIVLNPDFRNQRKQFLKQRLWEYDIIRALKDDFFEHEAERREEALIEKEKYFGLKHDYSFGDKSIVIVD